MVAGRQVAQVGAAGLQRLGGQPLGVDVHQRAGQGVVLQYGPGAGVAGVFHRRPAAGKQMGQTPQQILDAGAHHDLLRRALHPAIGGKIFGNLHPQGLVALHLATLQQFRPLVEQLPLDAPPAPGGEQGGVHAAGGQIVPRGRNRLRRFRRGRSSTPGPTAVQHAVGLLHIEAAAGPRLGQALGRQHLVGGVHCVDAHPQLGRHGAPPRQRRAGGALPAADLVGQGGIQLFIKGCLLLTLQFNHGSSLPNWHHKKIKNWAFIRSQKTL